MNFFLNSITVLFFFLVGVNFEKIYSFYRISVDPQGYVIEKIQEQLPWKK